MQTIVLIWSVLFSTLAAEQRVLYSRFQSGRATVFDDSGKTLTSIPVENQAGQVGLEADLRRDSLYITDGNQNHRLRVLRLTTGQKLAEVPVPLRLLQYGGHPTELSTALSALFVYTFDPAGAADGVRIFNLATLKFEPMGLRDRPCGKPLMAVSPAGVVAMACAHAIAFASGNPIGSTGPRGVRLTGPRAVTLSMDGKTLWALDNDFVVYSIDRATLETTARTDLKKLTGFSAQQAPSFAIDDKGARLGIVNGSKAWIIRLGAQGAFQTVGLPGACEGAAFAEGGEFATTCRSGGNMLFVRVNASGSTSQWTLDSNVGAAPVLWRLVRR